MPLKISKPTFDVNFADNDELSFNSELATHSIYNIVSFSKSSGTNTATFNHNLGYRPKVWIFLDEGSTLGRIPRYIDPNYPKPEDVIDYYITTTQIVIRTYATGGSYSFRAIIFTRSPSV